MTTEADQPTTSPLALLAQAMEMRAIHYNNTKSQLEEIKAFERAAFKQMNDTRRAFNDAVNALKPKRPKKLPPPTLPVVPPQS